MEMRNMTQKLPSPRPTLEAAELARRFGYMPYMIQRYMHIFGSREELLSFLAAVEKGLPKYLRCNTLALGSCDELVRTMREKGWELVPIGWLPYAYRVEGGGKGRLSSTLEYLLGYFYVQGLGSMTAAVALNPVPEDRVADLAAAPGGKTTHIAQLMKNKGVILSVDKDPVRTRSLLANIERMRVRIAVVLVEDILELRGLEGLFDRVLLDAPCSGEGLLPVKKERKLRWTFEDLVQMHSLQVRLLHKAVELLKPGGVLTYATCSIAPEENEFVLDSVLSKRVDVRIERAPSLGVGEPGLVEFMGHRLNEDLRMCKRFYPHKHNSEGFFVCNLRRV